MPPSIHWGLLHLHQCCVECIIGDALSSWSMAAKWPDIRAERRSDPDPERAVLDGMLDGWRAQQTARSPKAPTIAATEWLVRRFVDFTGMYPWQWTPAEAEGWVGELRSGA